MGRESPLVGLLPKTTWLIKCWRLRRLNQEAEWCEVVWGGLLLPRFLISGSKALVNAVHPFLTYWGLRKEESAIEVFLGQRHSTKFINYFVYRMTQAQTSGTLR